MRAIFILSLLTTMSFNPLFGRGSKVKDQYAAEVNELCVKRVNLARKKWTIRTDVPVLDQGPVRMCGPFASAAYLDIWRAWQLPHVTQVMDVKPPKTLGGTPVFGGLKLKKRLGLTSPYWMGFLGKISEQAQTGKIATNFEDASGELALDVVVRGLNSICREDVMRQSLMPYSKDGMLVTLPEFYSFTAWFFERFNKKIEAQLTRKGIYEKRVCRKRAGVVADKLKCDNARKELGLAMVQFAADKSNLKGLKGREVKLIKNFLKKAKIHKIWPAMKANMKNDKKKYLPFFSSVFYKCEIRGNKYRETSQEVMQNYNVCSVENNHSTQFVLHMLQKLQNNEPIAFNYYVGILNAKKHSDVQRLSNLLHQSVLIGNRVRKNRCQFLVQNSWGNYCRYNWECQRDEKGNEIGVWVDSYELQNVIKSMYYIEKKNVTCPKFTKG